MADPRRLAAALAAPLAFWALPAAAVELRGVWSEAERAAVAQAVARLPAEVRERAPRVVLRDLTDCALSDGERWPADDRLIDDRGNAHLCGPVPGAPPAPDAVATQVAWALAFGFDRAARWSEDADWRRLNGWRPSLLGGLRAANTSPAGFASPRGRRSPRWDLATTLVAIAGDSAEGAEPWACRLMSQAAFLRRKLATGASAIADHPAPRCATFEAWADLDRLAEVEVVLAAPSTAMVGSLFGHLFLRLAYRDDEGELPPHLSSTVAFLANNDVPFEEDVGYAWKGITGFYEASLQERPFLDSYRDYVAVEGRDLRRWRLNLRPDERRALMERIWTVAHGTRTAYYFFRRNCATLMVDLVGDAVPAARAIAAPGLLAAPPASTLEPWAVARGADGGPLISYVPEPVLGFDHEARLTARHRAELEPGLAAALPGLAAAAATEAFRDAHAPDPGVRARAYAHLGRLLAPPANGGGQGDDSSAAGADDLLAWLRDSAVLESHLSTRANLEKEAAADRARRARARVVADEVAARLRADATTIPNGPRLAAAVEAVDRSDPTERLTGYRGLAALAADAANPPEVRDRIRLLALLRSEIRYDVARMKGEPGLRDPLLFPDARRPIDEQGYAARHADLIRVPIETRISPPLRALQQAKQALFAARRLGDRTPPDRDAEVATVRRSYDAALPRSGLDLLSLSIGAVTGAGSSAVGIALGGALYDERLGDHRRFGFPSDTALVVGRSAALFTATEGLPQLAFYDARVFGYRSLRPPLPESGAGTWPLGWELYADLSGSRARAVGAAPRIGCGLLAPLLDRGELTDHLLAAFGVAYAGFFPTAAALPGAGHPQALSVPLALELRWGLGAAPRYRSSLGARAWLEPMAVLAAAPRKLALETGAALEVRFAPAPGSDRARREGVLLVRAQVARSTLGFGGEAASADIVGTGSRPVVEALLSFGIELR